MYEAGTGTHLRDNYICASLVGTKRVVPAEGTEQVTTLQHPPCPTHAKGSCSAGRP